MEARRLGVEINVEKIFFFLGIETEDFFSNPELLEGDRGCSVGTQLQLIFLVGSSHSSPDHFRQLSKGAPNLWLIDSDIDKDRCLVHTILSEPQEKVFFPLPSPAEYQHPP